MKSLTLLLIPLLLFMTWCTIDWNDGKDKKIVESKKEIQEFQKNKEQNISKSVNNIWITFSWNINSNVLSTEWLSEMPNYLDIKYNSTMSGINLSISILSWDRSNLPCLKQNYCDSWEISKEFQKVNNWINSIKWLLSKEKLWNTQYSELRKQIFSLYPIENANEYWISSLWYVYDSEKKKIWISFYKCLTQENWCILTYTAYIIWNSWNKILIWNWYSNIDNKDRWIRLSKEEIQQYIEKFQWNSYILNNELSILSEKF